MLVGYPPFYDEQPFGIYEKILSGKIEWERHMDPIAKDLIKKLLVNDRTKRLGNMKVRIIGNQFRNSIKKKINNILCSNKLVQLGKYLTRYNKIFISV